jgi:hypothetical protein
MLAVVGAVPDAGVICSQGWFATAVQENVPPLVSVSIIVRSWEGGNDPPSLPLKLRLTGLTPRPGGKGAEALPISTYSRYAGGNTVVEPFPPTTIASRGFVKGLTTLPDNWVQLAPLSNETKAVSLSVT